MIWWYNLAGGGAELLIVEYDDANALTAFLQPYMELTSFDVRAITQPDYAVRVAELRGVRRSGLTEVFVSAWDGGADGARTATEEHRAESLRHRQGCRSGATAWVLAAQASSETGVA